MRVSRKFHKKRYMFGKRSRMKKLRRKLVGGGEEEEEDEVFDKEMFQLLQEFTGKQDFRECIKALKVMLRYENQINYHKVIYDRFTLECIDLAQRNPLEINSKEPRWRDQPVQGLRLAAVLGLLTFYYASYLYTKKTCDRSQLDTEDFQQSLEFIRENQEITMPQLLQYLLEVTSLFTQHGKYIHSYINKLNFGYLGKDIGIVYPAVMIGNLNITFSRFKDLFYSTRESNGYSFVPVAMKPCTFDPDKNAHCGDYNNSLSFYRHDLLHIKLSSLAILQSIDFDTMKQLVRDHEKTNDDHFNNKLLDIILYTHIHEGMYTNDNSPTNFKELVLMDKNNKTMTIDICDISYILEYLLTSEDIPLSIHDDITNTYHDLKLNPLPALDILNDLPENSDLKQRYENAVDFLKDLMVAFVSDKIEKNSIPTFKKQKDDN